MTTTVVLPQSFLYCPTSHFLPVQFFRGLIPGQSQVSETLQGHSMTNHPKDIGFNTQNCAQQKKIYIYTFLSNQVKGSKVIVGSTFGQFWTPQALIDL